MVRITIPQGSRRETSVRPMPWRGKLLIWASLALVASLLAIAAALIWQPRKLRFDGVKEVYEIQDEVSCRLVNDSDRVIDFHYTGEGLSQGRWREVDYSLERFSKTVPMHSLKPHEAATLIWPRWRRVETIFLGIGEGPVRFVVYYYFS